MVANCHHFLEAEGKTWAVGGKAALPGSSSAARPSPVCKPPPKPRKPKHIIPQELRAVYAAVHAQAVELRQGMTHPEVCDELNRLGYRTRTGKLWRHPQQIIKLLRSFSSDG